MPWWGWITVGALLLLAELSVVDLEFYLVFLGASALATGLLVLGGAPLPFWGQWIVFAILAGGSLVFFRRGVYARLRPPPEGDVGQGVVGERAVAESEIAPGASGPVRLRGSIWTARNVGSTLIAARSECHVESHEGLTLEVRAGT